jgi:hypothetical protein
VWRKRLLTALAIIAAAAIGILVANAFVDTSGDHAAADPGLAAQTDNEPPATEPAPITPPPTWSSDANQADLTTTPITPPAGSVQLTPQAMVSVLRTYLGLLPADPTQAWTFLTPAEQARSGGFGKYQQTWQAVQAVQVDGTAPHGGNAVLARIKLTTQNGQQTDDFYNVQFVSQNGSVLINDFSVVGRPNRHG